MSTAHGELAHLVPGSPRLSSEAEQNHGWRPQDDHDELEITALVVIEAASHPAVEQALAALAAQSRPPDQVVLIDATPEHAVRAVLDSMPTLRPTPERSPLTDSLDWQSTLPEVSVVAVPAPGASFADSIDLAVAALPGQGEDHVVQRRSRDRGQRRPVRSRDRFAWFWLLPQDGEPDVDALQALVGAVRRSSRIGIAGCKIVHAHDPDRLINVGLQVSRTGRQAGVHLRDDVDQGQHDDRHDVLAVSSPGMLVRRDVYSALGGFDPAFDGDGDGLDLCWRTHLLGHQVVVVPSARIFAGSPPEPGDRLGSSALRPHPRPGGPDRHAAAHRARRARRYRQVALARCSLLAWPVMSVWIALSSVALAGLLLLVKRPRSARSELLQATAPLGVKRILLARVRFGRQARTRRRHLEGLFVPWSQAAGAVVDSVRSELAREPLPAGSAGLFGDSGAVAGAPLDPHRRSATSRALRHAGWWMTVALVVLSALRWRPLWDSPALRGTGQGLSGGVLLPFATDSGGVWQLWQDRWGGAGLGELSPERPYLPVLAAGARLVEFLPWVNPEASAATALTWLLALALPLSGISAYLAGRAATRAPWPRAVAGLAWAGLATVLTAQTEGRIGPLVGHVLLPLVVAGTLAVARRTAGCALTCSTALAAAVMGAFAPPLLLASTLLALGVVAGSVARARWRAAAVALLPWLLLGPWLAQVAREPRALVAGPGGLSGHSAAAPWQLALLHPGGPDSYLSWWSAPVLVLGLLGLLGLGQARRGRGRVRLALAVTALAGLAAALGAGRLTVSTSAAGSLRSWAGFGIDLMAVALIAAALLAFGDALRAGASARIPARRRLLVASLAATGLWAGAVVLLAAAQQPLRTLSTAAPSAPAVVEHVGRGGLGVRMLAADERTHAAGARFVGREVGAPAIDLDSPVPVDPAADQTWSALLNSGAQAQVQARTRLAELGVGFVGVRRGGLALPERGSETAPQTARQQAGEASRLLASVPGLLPMASTEQFGLWRVMPSAPTVPLARLRIERSGVPVGFVPVTGSHARGALLLPPGAARTLVVGEPLGWATGAQVQVDGRSLRRVAGAAAPTYRLPERGGVLQVAPGSTYGGWRWAQGALVLLTAFLAVPLGQARSGRGSTVGAESTW